MQLGVSCLVNLFSLLTVEEALSCILHDCVGVWTMLFLSDVDTEKFKDLDPLHYSPIDVDGGVLGSPFPVVHDQVLCLADVEGEVVVLAPHCQVTDLLPIGFPIVVVDQAYHSRVVRKHNDGAGVVHDHAVVDEQEVQARTPEGPPC